MRLSPVEVINVSVSWLIDFLTLRYRGRIGASGKRPNDGVQGREEAAHDVNATQAGNVAEQQTGINVDDPQAAATAVAGQVQQATEQAEEAIAAADNPQTFEAVRNGALGTLLGLLLPLLASALGGWVGRYERTDLVHGTV